MLVTIFDEQAHSGWGSPRPETRASQYLLLGNAQGRLWGGFGPAGLEPESDLPGMETDARPGQGLHFGKCGPLQHEANEMKRGQFCCTSCNEETMTKESKVDQPEISEEQELLMCLYALDAAFDRILRALNLLNARLV